MVLRLPITEAARRAAWKAGFCRWRSVGVTLLSLLAACSLNAAQPKEYEVKAAFLLNFARFVEWQPKAYADTNAALVIGIVGDDPFGEVLPQIVQGQTVQGRQIEIRHFTADEDFGVCHVLFLSRSVAAQTEEILRRLQNRSVLTVSEKEDFVRRGGVIGFAMVDNCVRFDINPKAAEAAELKLSSKLLAVARSVVKSS